MNEEIFEDYEPTFLKTMKPTTDTNNFQFKYVLITVIDSDKD